jgi:hypothetical protein
MPADDIDVKSGAGAQGDALADAAMAELVGQGSADPRALLQAARARAEAGGPACRALLEAASDVPRWVEFGRMFPAQRRAESHALLSGLCLRTGSLMESFAAPRAAWVLVGSGRLRSEPQLRLYRTARFVHGVVASGGAPPGTVAHGDLVAVRLVHAWVRAHARQSGRWPIEWGCPIDQEDTLSTLTMFSHVFVRSMGRLGVAFSPEEAAAHQHMWRWAGHVLGVEDTRLPTSVESEARLYGVLAARRFAPDDDGRALAHGLLRAMAGQAPFYLPLPALYAVCRRHLGDALADAFAIPRTDGWPAAVAAFAAATTARARAQRGLPASVQAPVARLGRLMAQRIIERGLRADETP